jgi:hypothetical protein
MIWDIDDILILIGMAAFAWHCDAQAHQDRADRRRSDKRH